MAPQKFALILGSEGALGREVVSKLRASHWNLVCCDVVQAGAQRNNFIKLDPNTPPENGVHEIESMLSAVSSGSKLDAIINISGGFVMDNANTACLLRNLSLMYASSIQSSAIAAYLAGRHLNSHGLLLLPGAAAAARPTPMALTYGCMKAAVHQMVKSLASPGSGIPETSQVVGLAPVMLDTEANRRAMPDADYSTWTSCDLLASQIVRWAEHLDEIQTGTIIKVVTQNGCTSFNEI